MRFGRFGAFSFASLCLFACSDPHASPAPSASAVAAVKPDDATLAAASARASLGLPPPRPIPSGTPLGVDVPRDVSITLPPGFTKTDSGYQFVKATRGDLELTLVAGIEKGALPPDRDLADTLATDARSVAKRFDASGLQGVLEALPVETDGAGKAWERLHFRAWVDVTEGQGLRIIVNLKFPAGTRAAHEQEFADVIATIKVGPPPVPQPEESASAAAAASASAAPSASPAPPKAAVSGSHR
jgi:hypothetical protein